MGGKRRLTASAFFAAYLPVCTACPLVFSGENGVPEGLVSRELATTPDDVVLLLFADYVHTVVCVCVSTVEIIPL